MAFEDDMTAAGHTMVPKKRFFVLLDDDGNPETDVEEYARMDKNGNPIDIKGIRIHPHVWVPAGKKLRCYTDDSRTVLDNKIETKAKPDIEIGVEGLVHGRQ